MKRKNNAKMKLYVVIPGWAFHGCVDEKSANLLFLTKT
jgi:hypothetical protein